MGRLETRLRRIEAAHQAGGGNTALLVLVPYGASEEEQARLMVEAEAEHGRSHALNVLVGHYGDWPPPDGRLSWVMPMVR
jgi:hypothetical protein